MEQANRRRTRSALHINTTNALIRESQQHDNNPRSHNANRARMSEFEEDACMRHSDASLKRLLKPVQLIGETSEWQCSICLERLQNDVLCETMHDVCTGLSCGHAFHKECVVPWLRKHSTCPVCRSNVQ